jgi:hypothetical protein
LDDFARSKSPKKFTQPQLLACLIVKEFSRKDYRGIHIMLTEWSDLRNILGLTKVPHFTTLCQAEKRLLTKRHADSVFASVLARCRKAKLLKKRTKLAAIDSTGLETRHVSSYFTRRCGRHKAHKKHRYPKLTALCDTGNHLILGIMINRGPKPDHIEARGTVDDALRQQQFETLLGDAGYESEGFHCYCRDQLGIESIIPTTQRGRSRDDGRPRKTNGYYRQMMTENFPKKTYGQRWQIETVFSMIKRNFGSALRSRNYHNQTREIRARILTHNIAILLW